jgi:glutamate--cysteine ligase regulatory subunit
MYAKEEKIDLLTHDDCTDILSGGTTRELLGQGEKGAIILAARSNASDEEQLAVVKNKGVIEKKGYFTVGQLGSCIELRSTSKC